MKVKILADSTCDLGEALLKRYGVDIISLYVTLDEKSYQDGLDMTADQMIAICEEKGLSAKTSANSVGDFIEFFRPYAEAGQDIVFFSIAEGFSSEVQNARIAAEEFPDRVIRCVNSDNLSTGIGLLVIQAAERANAGMSAHQIADEVEALRPKVRASFVLDTLTYLYRGGRCSGLAALGAAVLNLKPQISVIDGGMRPTDKYRGNICRVALKYVDKQLEALDAIRPERVFITYSSGFDEDIKPIVEHVKAKGYFNEVLCTKAGCVISGHCGPRCMGILFLNK